MHKEILNILESKIDDHTKASEIIKAMSIVILKERNNVSETRERGFIAGYNMCVDNLLVEINGK